MIKRIIDFLKGTTNIAKAKKNGLIVGKNVFIGAGTFIDPSHCFLIKIGDNVTLSSRVHILAHDASTKVHTGYTKIGGVDIGNDVFVGAHAIILPGVTIGDNAIIGAGSVVTHNVPAGEIWAGNPAHYIKKTHDYIEKISAYKWFDKSYQIGSITDEKKKELQDAVSNGFCFIE